MTTSLDLELFKEHFEELIEQSKAKLSSLDVNQNFIAKGDDVEMDANDRMRSLGLKLQWREALYIKKLKHALKKIEDGEFGICEDCGIEISEGRLKARPTATLCIACKEEAEKEEGQILYQDRSHTTGKGLASHVAPNLSDEEDVFNENLVNAIKTAKKISFNAANNF